MEAEPYLGLQGKRKEDDDLSSISKKQNMKTANDIAIKFLVPTNIAGSIIGKGGENISVIQAQSNTKVHMSRTEEVFPGTRDRVCAIYAEEMQAILMALHLILTKIKSEDEFNTFTFKMIVPKGSCGAIIGKGGSAIKGIMEETGSNIKVSSQDDTPPGILFRLVTMISDTVDQQLKAVALLLQKALDESDYQTQIRMYDSKIGSMNYFQTPKSSILHQNECSPIPSVPEITASMVTTATLWVPDEYVGGIIGKSGMFVKEVKSSTQADVKISSRNDQVGPGNDNRRKVEIVGLEENVKKAGHIIIEKLRKTVENNNRL